MTTEHLLPDADPADVAEQLLDVVPPDDDRAPADRGDLPWSADEADVAEQRRDVPAADDEFDRA
jgi:hypothetical protein